MVALRREERAARARSDPARSRPLLLLAGCLLASAAGARAEEARPAGDGPAPFRMAGDNGPSRSNQAFTQIYQEAFRRLGIPVELSFHSLVRRTALVTAGAIDGEMARIRAYGDAHPELIRVEEPILDFPFALFTARPDLRLESLEALRRQAYRVDYRRGILLCETTLGRLLPPERITDVLTTEQGVKKLQAGRTDLFCELDFHYVEDVLESPEFRGTPPVRRVLRFATLPTYPYLHRRHAALAPRLAEVIRQMKAEGRMDKHLRDAGIDPGGQP
ncbi:MAG: hypothetical protein HZB56_07470 [Deltaproteobacteria bacterium]|nr:hypothetical protein [Deltaproteobacteria bacterium]